MSADLNTLFQQVVDRIAGAVVDLQTYKIAPAGMKQRIARNAIEQMAEISGGPDSPLPADPRIIDFIMQNTITLLTLRDMLIDADETDGDEMKICNNLIIDLHTFSALFGLKLTLASEDEINDIFNHDDDEDPS